MLNPDRQTTLLCVPPAEIEKLWHVVAPMIDRAYEAVDQTTPDVLRWLLDGKGLLWVAATESEIVAVLTTSLVIRRSGLALRMVAASGRELDFCRLHLGEIEEYARREGCCKVEFDGRSGWGRLLHGYVPKIVSFEKRL